MSETFVINEVRALRERGSLVRLVTVGSGEMSLSPPEEDWTIRLSTLPAVPRWADIRASRRYSDDDWLTRLWAPIAARRVLRELSTWRPDVVHVSFIDKPMVLGLHIARLLRVPLTVTAHAADYLVNTSPQVLRARVKAANAVFAISEEGALQIAALADVDPCTPTPIRIVRAIARYQPDTSPSPHGRYLTSVARLVPKKGIDISIQAFSHMTPCQPALKYFIVGDGPERSALEHLARDLDLNDRVFFLGALPPPRAQRILAGAELLVLPCRHTPTGDADGIPVALIEAGLAGVPVLTTAIGGITELIEHNSSGLLVPPDDIDATSKAMSVLTTDGQVREICCSGLRTRIHDEFSEGLQCDRLYRAWDDVVGLPALRK